MTETTFPDAVEIPLKYKYTVRKPIGGYRSDYAGNSGTHRHKGLRAPAIPGTGARAARRQRRGGSKSRLH